MGLVNFYMNEGREAAFDGRPLSSNPYTLHGDGVQATRYYSWAVGWLSQNRKIERAKWISSRNA